METVNNVVNSASKMIWGEGATKHTEEPVSGQTGAGTISDPYDKGNTSGETPVDTTTSTTTNPTSTSTSTSTSSTSPTMADTTQTNPSTNDPATVSSSTNPVPAQKHQGADRPTETPNEEETSAINKTSEVAETQQSETHHPITDEEREKLAENGQLPKIPDDHSGEPMQMHSTAPAEESTDTSEAVSGGKVDRSASVAHEGGGTHGKVEGTGEQWIKTSGMAAEGGDFDATKPGAGKEANRLLEAKGIKKDESGKMATEDGSSPDLGGSTDDVKKESKMARLKEKLHIGSGKQL